MKTIDVAGQVLRVAIQPGSLDGPPLLLCNGGSPPARRPMRMAGLAQLIMAMLDRLGYSTVDVLGVSWGGFLAQELAHQFPTRVRKLVLAATAAGGMAIPGRLSTLATMANPRRYRDPDHLVSMAGQLYGGAMRTHPELARTYLGRSRPPSTRGYFGQMFALAGWTSIFWLHRLQQPTLVLAGRDDPLCPVTNGQLLASRIPRARLVTVADGHLFLATSAQTVAPVVRDFLLAQDT
jgi:poly(3-hydroxyalkanoate) depolymerase